MYSVFFGTDGVLWGHGLSMTGRPGQESTAHQLRPVKGLSGAAPVRVGADTTVSNSLGKSLRLALEPGSLGR